VIKTGAFNINGDYPAFNKIDPYNVKGRFINKLDINKTESSSYWGK